MTIARKFANPRKRKQEQQKKHKKSLIVIELQFTLSTNKKKYNPLLAMHEISLLLHILLMHQRANFSNIDRKI